MGGGEKKRCHVVTFIHNLFNKKLYTKVRHCRYINYIFPGWLNPLINVCIMLSRPIYICITWVNVTDYIVEKPHHMIYFDSRSQMHWGGGWN